MGRTSSLIMTNTIAAPRATRCSPDQSDFASRTAAEIQSARQPSFRLCVGPTAPKSIEPRLIRSIRPTAAHPLNRPPVKRTLALPGPIGGLQSTVHFLLRTTVPKATGTPKTVSTISSTLRLLSYRPPLR